MKKKILSLLFSSVLVLQNNIFFPVKALGDQPILPMPATPVIRAERCNIDDIKFMDLKISKRIKATPQHSCDMFLVTKDIDKIKSLIGNKLIHVLINQNISWNTPWVIFRSASKGYICYQSNSPFEDNRAHIEYNIREFITPSICLYGDALIELINLNFLNSNIMLDLGN